MLDVEHLCSRYDLSKHAAVLRRGALVARNPLNWHHLVDLEPEERDALAFEGAHKWAGEASPR